MTTLPLHLQALPFRFENAAPLLRKRLRFHTRRSGFNVFAKQRQPAAHSRKLCRHALSNAARRGGGSIAPIVPTPAAPTLRAAALRNGALFPRYARQTHPPLCASPFPANAAQVRKRAQPSPRRFCALRFCRPPSGQPMQPLCCAPFPAKQKPPEKGGFMALRQGVTPAVRNRSPPARPLRCAPPNAP